MMYQRNSGYARAAAQRDADAGQKPLWLYCSTDGMWRTTYVEPPDLRTWAGVVYEKIVPTPPELLDVNNFKRLLAANDLGIRLYQENGHRYIQWLAPDESDSDVYHDFYGLYNTATGDGLPIKEYGSFADALDKIDKVLETIGYGTLLQNFHKMRAGDWMAAWGLDEATRAMMKKDKTP